MVFSASTVWMSVAGLLPVFAFRVYFGNALDAISMRFVSGLVRLTRRSC
jgi:hypothetical protein